MRSGSLLLSLFYPAILHANTGADPAQMDEVLQVELSVNPWQFFGLFVANEAKQFLIDYHISRGDTSELLVMDVDYFMHD